MPKIQQRTLLISVSGERNALVSPLLRLPAEVREMIWTHAMSGYIIKPRSLLFVKEVPPVVEFRFSLLLVSQQTYHETAVLPHRLNTIAFACFGDFNGYRDMGQLRFMRKMRIGIRIRDDEDCTRLFPLERLPALTEVDITLCTAWPRGDEERRRLKDALRADLAGKQVTIRFGPHLQDWHITWRSL